MKTKLLILITLIVCFSCKTDENNSQTTVFDTTDLNHANKVLLESVMDDAFTPPVASRMY